MHCKYFMPNSVYLYLYIYDLSWSMKSLEVSAVFKIFILYGFQVYSLVVRQSYTLHKVPLGSSCTSTGTIYNYHSIIDQPWPVWLSWLERPPVHQKVESSIPGQGTYPGFRFDSWSEQLINVSLSHGCFFLSLKSFKNLLKTTSISNYISYAFLTSPWLLCNYQFVFRQVSAH